MQPWACVVDGGLPRGPKATKGNAAIKTKLEREGASLGGEAEANWRLG